MPETFDEHPSVAPFPRNALKFNESPQCLTPSHRWQMLLCRCKHNTNRSLQSMASFPEFPPPASHDLLDGPPFDRSPQGTAGVWSVPHLFLRSDIQVRLQLLPICPETFRYIQPAESQRITDHWGKLPTSIGAQTSCAQEVRHMAATINGQSGTWTRSKDVGPSPCACPASST